LRLERHRTIPQTQWQPSDMECSVSFRNFASMSLGKAEGKCKRRLAVDYDPRAQASLSASDSEFLQRFSFPAPLLDSSSTIPPRLEHIPPVIRREEGLPRYCGVLDKR
jgi:hypothetical protein